MLYSLEKIYNFKIDDYDENETVSIRIGNLLSFLGFSVSIIYGFLYLIFVDSLIISFATFFFAFSYLVYFYLIKINELKKAKVSFFIVILFQLFIIVVFFLSTKSGIQYYYFLVPPTAYLMFNKERKLRFTISAISFLLLILCHLYGTNYHILDLNDGILNTLHIITIIIIFFVFTVLFNTFLSEISKKEEKLEHLSKTDYLTKILNRRAFYSKANEMIKLSERYGNEIGLLIFDIDYFKKINDKYGHDTGDLVLVELCKELSKAIRTTDYFGRFGGEEFIILLPDISKDELLNFSEKIRIIVEKIRIKNLDVEDITFTISIGATVLLKNDNLESLIKRADKAMYEAKNSGRNVVNFLC